MNPIDRCGKSGSLQPWYKLYRTVACVPQRDICGKPVKYDVERAMRPTRAGWGIASGAWSPGARPTSS